MAMTNENQAMQLLVDITTREQSADYLNSLYEEMLKLKLTELTEAVRTQIVKQNGNFPGIAGPVYGAQTESTVNIQTGLPAAPVILGEPMWSNETDGNY